LIRDEMIIEALNQGYLVQKADERFAFATLAEIADQVVKFLTTGPAKLKLTIEEVKDGS